MTCALKRTAAYNKFPDKVINLAFAIKNTEEHLDELIESQLTSTPPKGSNFVPVAAQVAAKVRLAGVPHHGELQQEVRDNTWHIL